MKCRDARKRLPHLHRGELSDEVAGLVRDHLAQCAACRGLAAEYQGLGDLANDVPPIQEPPGFYDGLFSEIMARARKPVASSAGFGFRFPDWLARRPPRLAWAGALAAVLLVITVSGWYLLGPLQQPRRSLESYLLSGDLQALEHAMQDDEHRAKLLNDSVSVDLLIETLTRLQKTQARHGQTGDHLLRAVSLVQATPTDGKSGRLMSLVRRGRFDFRRALTALRSIRQTQSRITVARLTWLGSPANRS